MEKPYYEQTFTSHNFLFRFKKINIFDLDEFKWEVTTYSKKGGSIEEEAKLTAKRWRSICEFALDHLQYNIQGDVWNDCRQGNLLLPKEIETNIDLLEEIGSKCLELIISPLFTKSKESKATTK